VDGIADFSGGEYYDSFDDSSVLGESQLEGLENEVEGTVHRVDGFFLPLMSQRIGRTAGLRVLDCGCGNGLSVDLLRAAGVAAWGNDLSQLRRWQWRQRENREHLLVADGAKLPFPDGFFDVVISSGVIEHIGVEERGGEGYFVRPLPHCGDARTCFLGELLRVVSPGGRLWLDFPNGAFPIDFWHGPSPGGARWHSLREGFLPKLNDVRHYVRPHAGDWKVRALPPRGRLRFRQVGAHWYGRLLAPLAELGMRMMSVPGLKWLRGSSVNPYLVLEIRRSR